HMAEPEIEREVAMRGNQGGIVIGRFRIDVVSARRLDRDRHPAEDFYRQPERALSKEGVAFGRAPPLDDVISDGLGQGFETFQIVLYRQSPSLARMRGKGGARNARRLGCVRTGGLGA